MNKAQLQKLVGRHVKFRPVAIRSDHLTGGQLETVDDRWLVTASDAKAGLSVSVPLTPNGESVFQMAVYHEKQFRTMKNDAINGTLSSVLPAALSAPSKVEFGIVR